MTRRFVVTGANGDVADAVGRILRDAYVGVHLTGTDIGGSWPGELTFDRMVTVPHAEHSDYPDALRAVAEAANANLVIPCSDAEQYRLATDPGAARDLPLLTARADLVAAFCDKLATATWMERHGLPVARTAPLADARADWLPVIVKPRTGQGSKGIQLIRSAAHLADVMADGTMDHVVQTYLPDDEEEYTCALFGWRGDIRSLTLRRTLVGGLTGRAQVVAHSGIQQLLDRICEAAQLDGPLNVQLRMTDDGPVVFEINPRYSSTVMMRHRIGFADLIWGVEAWLTGASPPAFEPPVGTRMARLSHEVILP